MLVVVAFSRSKACPVSAGYADATNQPALLANKGGGGQSTLTSETSDASKFACPNALNIRLT